MSERVLSMILAGGAGTRLYPLTMDRSKPAVPFGGRYRIIDFVINNFINSGFYKIKILTQFKSDSLNTHISRGWPVSRILGQYIDLVPAQMRTGGDWYKGTADAIYQNINLIFDENPDHVCIFGGDHIYRMDVREMLKYHLTKDSDITISAIPVHISEADQFGIIQVDDDFRVIGFQEKPKENASTIPGHPDLVLASMGNYIFKKDCVIEELLKDSKEDTDHDFGKSILSKIYKERNVFVYDFKTNKVPGTNEEGLGYWRDVGTIDAYWKAHMDLVSVNPEFDLHNKFWPINTFVYNAPPAKFMWSLTDRIGMATDSMISEGCVISGGQISKSILAPNVKVNSFSTIKESIIFEGANIGRYAEIYRTIIDKNIDVPPRTQIGINHKADKERGLYVTDTGITVVPKGFVFK